MTLTDNKCTSASIHHRMTLKKQAISNARILAVKA